MPKYHGKFEKTSRPRLFLWIGVGCSVLALVCACFIVKFLYGAVKADSHRRRTIQTYVLPVPATPEITEITAPEEETAETTEGTTVETTEETTMSTEPPRFPTIDFAGLREKNKDVVAWLQIPALEIINYPVVLGENNAYYTTHA